MPLIDLTRYIVAAAGTWTDPSKDDSLFGFSLADTRSPGRLLLRWVGDFVALSGPLRIRVTVQAENMTVPLALVGNLMPDATGLSGRTWSLAGGGVQQEVQSGVALKDYPIQAVAKGRALGLQASTIYSYTLDIAAGQAWPFSLSEQLDALRLQSLYASRFEQLGNNLGYRVIIEPAFAVANLVPVVSGADLPCDFAVADHPNTASFFPVACEPCEGSVVGLPPCEGVSLVTPPANGGCVRTRFFNGMFITREDLETEQRYHRLKSRLHNRASGAGVVWGLAVGTRGSQICVLPGYGVDCCGNDLTLTTVYEVEIPALLADPAAASVVCRRGSHRMHLLLEYVECPSAPRPVHGDPCAPEASRCEMSRIRESVRLRLVPPCDYNAAKASAPLTHFLNEVRTLRERHPLGAGPAVVGAVDRAPFTLRITLNTVTAGPAAPGRPTAPVGPAAPVGATVPGGPPPTAAPPPTGGPVTVRPSSQFDRTQFQRLIGAAASSVQINAVPDPLWTFSHGSMSGQALRGSETLANVVQPSTPVDLSLANQFPSNERQMTFSFAQAQLPDHIVFKLSNWEAQTFLAREDDPLPSGDLTLNITFTGNQVTDVSLAETPIAWQPLALAAPPCEGEPCGGRPSVGPAGACVDSSGNILYAAGTASSDPTPVLPWLHLDPLDQKGAGDPKALLLAALGGWLAQMLVREQAGTASEVASTRREIAQGIYRIAWLMLFGVANDADADAAGGTLKRLLQGWCSGLLWKGPECPCDPHGVVIGCAVVEGGTIQEIDAFGGRRHVIHYPLLEHWGAQFGIAPLDVMASRFFSALCCVSALPAVSPRRPEVPAARIDIGGAILLFGDRSRFAAKLDQGQQIVAKRQVGTAEFIGSVIAAFGSEARTNTRQPQYTALVLADVVADQTVMLLQPA